MLDSQTMQGLWIWNARNISLSRPFKNDLKGIKNPFQFINWQWIHIWLRNLLVKVCRIPRVKNSSALEPYQQSKKMQFIHLPAKEDLSQVSYQNTNRSSILTLHNDRIFWKNLIENNELVFKNGIINIQYVGYNGARKDIGNIPSHFGPKWRLVHTYVGFKICYHMLPCELKSIAKEV